jgi:hypothetical protein
MSRMIDLIRQSAVPSNVLRSASRGALELPPAEVIEVLVCLAAHPVFGEQARMTLASWDEPACRAVCADPNSPREVLAYFLAAHNRRPRLMPALLANPAISEAELLLVAQEQSRETVALLLASARVCASPNVLQALSSHPMLTAQQQEYILQALGSRQQTAEAPPATAEEPQGDAELDRFLNDFLNEHAAEILAEEGKAFRFAAPEEEHAQAAAAAASSPAPAVPARVEEDRVSPLHRIAQLTVGQRVQVAMKGSKEERYILIRDGSKVVSSAVLESPKLTDQEVEMFASLKNVQESVLRGIAGKRKFMKQYAIVRALVNNPRCPIDVQLTLMKNLLPNDLRAVSLNKNVSETIRKVALKMYTEKTQKKKALE